MPNLLWFEWLKCERGYRIIELDYGEIEEPELVPGSSENSLIRRVRAKKYASEPTIRLLNLVKGNWSFLGDHDVSPYFVIPETDVDIPYHPLEQHSGIFMEFANSDETIESIEYLASKFGLLDKYLPAEPLVYWQLEIRKMKNMVKRWEECKDNGNLEEFINWFNKLRKANSSVILGKSYDHSRPSLYITPNSLSSAIELQFAQAVSADARLRKCAICPNWFSFGTGTGRRKSAIYCSDRCRKAAFLRSKK